MAKVLQKTAKPATEKQAPPDLALVDKKPSQPDAKPSDAAPVRESGTPRATTSHAWRDLHPARIWPD